jgi:hypothetical protein
LRAAHAASDGIISAENVGMAINQIECLGHRTKSERVRACRI